MYLLHPLDVKLHRKFVMLGSNGIRTLFEVWTFFIFHILFFAAWRFVKYAKNKQNEIFIRCFGFGDAAAATGNGCFVVIVIVGVISFRHLNRSHFVHARQWKTLSLHSASRTFCDIYCTKRWTSLTTQQQKNHNSRTHTHIDWVDWAREAYAWKSYDLWQNMKSK